MRETAIRVHGLYHISITIVLSNRYSSTTRMKLQYQLSGTKSGTEKGYTLFYLSTFSYFKSLN